MNFEVKSLIEKKVNLGHLDHDGGWWCARCCSFKDELTNQSVRKYICGWKSRIWLVTMTV